MYHGLITGECNLGVVSSVVRVDGREDCRADSSPRVLEESRAFARACRAFFVKLTSPLILYELRNDARPTKFARPRLAIGP